MTGRLTTALASIAETLASAVGRGTPGRSVLRLEELVEARMGVEDSGEASVEVYESQSRLLRPYQVRGQPVTPPGMAVAGVDSSSRALETPHADLVIGAVSVSAWGAPEAFDLPEIHRPYPMEPGSGRRPPYIYVLPNTRIGRLNSAPHATTLNPAGEEYDEDYSIYQALDEVRVSLENWALSDIIAWAAEARAAPIAALIDGPAYLVSRIMSMGRERYRRSWARLLDERLEALSRLERLGVPVVGVVKRVERSRLIAAARGVEPLLSRCGLEARGASDRSIIDAALRAGCFRWVPGALLRGPKLLVRTPGYGEKLVEYIVVPPGRWRVGPGGVRVYRLEYTPRTLAMLRERSMDPVQVFASDSVLRGALEPVTLALSDRRASAITRAVKRALASLLRERGVPLSYSTELEVEMDWWRG